MKFWICLLLGMINISAFSQVTLEIPLRSYFKSEAIKKNQVQSLVVYAEINEDGIENYGGSSNDIGGANGKILEFEFDSNGNISYKRMLDDSKGYPFISFGSDNRIEFYTFDKQGRFRYLYRENKEEIYQLTQEYDSNGNLVQSIGSIDGQVTSNQHFEWRKGKMIKFTDLKKKDEDDNSELFFDDQGRFTQFKDRDFQILLDYQQVGDTIKTRETIKDSTGINSIETHAYLEQFKDHLTSYTFTNEKGEVEIDMKVSNDDFGNATSYDLINRKNNRRRPNEIVEIHYRIENTYDHRELLVSRKFYAIKKDSETENLVRIERYIYDSEPLIFKFDKCDIFEEY